MRCAKSVALDRTQNVLWVYRYPAKDVPQLTCPEGHSLDTFQEEAHAGGTRTSHTAHVEENQTS